MNGPSGSRAKQAASLPHSIAQNAIEWGTPIVWATRRRVVDFIFLQPFVVPATGWMFFALAHQRPQRAIVSQWHEVPWLYWRSSRRCIQGLVGVESDYD